MPRLEFLLFEFHLFGETWKTLLFPEPLPQEILVVRVVITDCLFAILATIPDLAGRDITNILPTADLGFIVIAKRTIERTSESTRVDLSPRWSQSLRYPNTKHGP